MNNTNMLDAVAGRATGRRGGIFSLVLWLLASLSVSAQQQQSLEGSWVCAPVGDVKASGTEISQPGYAVGKWMKATVPGTVLTTLLDNGKVPDPFYGMNNNQIKDIYETGRDHYTYWFVRDFEERAKDQRQIWLHLRGVNYSAEIYLNGHKVNTTMHKGMFLRQVYNITSLLADDGKNRLAIIIYPPDPVGNANGGQGGDGTIARSVSHTYVAGWDWIQPIRDRNTGIWDKVYIEKTGAVNVKNPHVITRVPGVRRPNDPKQAPAIIRVSAELENPTGEAVAGVLQYVLEGKTISKEVTVAARSTEEIALPDYELANPKLWWPHGYGQQNLYDIDITFKEKKGTVSDTEHVRLGVREMSKVWNTTTRSMQVQVNGQKIFIKGGNWIISDAMLRLSEKRYDAEIRFHRDMNLNLIRVWGGALFERPEFYAACDKYGLLVMQDFWMSGDCNGRWLDPMKKEDQWVRRNYPDDHGLFLTSARDMIKMARNHPSLAIYCGGNEITPPEDILTPLRDEIIPTLDGTRWLIEYSNADSMSYNFLGGNGDGPYGIQSIETFWQNRTWPFNSEVGSVGVGDIESLKRFIPEDHLVAPTFNDKAVDPVWDYHKYIGYGEHMRPYGDAKDAADFTKKAQLINYNQYRALMEGFSAHMWEWYTGSIIWKTQNPWTAMRGQMYDYYLDPNACLYGLRKGSEPLHIMYNPVDGMVMGVNNGFDVHRDLMLSIETIDMQGKAMPYTKVFAEIGPTTAKKYLSVKGVLDQVAAKEGVFLKLSLTNTHKEVVAENFYWVPSAAGTYTGLNTLKPAALTATVKKTSAGQFTVTLTNPSSGPVAFFNRVALVDQATGKRVLPAFYDDNYVSLLPGEARTVTIDVDPKIIPAKASVSLEGWNVGKISVPVGQ
jgi:hypothetical protein